MNKFQWDRPHQPDQDPLSPLWRRITAAYVIAGLYLELLVYTEQYEQLCRYVQAEFPEQTRRTIWLTLCRMRTSGYLPVIGIREEDAIEAKVQKTDRSFPHTPPAEVSEVLSRVRDKLPVWTGDGRYVAEDLSLIAEDDPSYADGFRIRGRIRCIATGTMRHNIEWTHKGWFLDEWGGDGWSLFPYPPKNT